MRDWMIRLDFDARVDWLEPPENTAEQCRRDTIDVRLGGQIKELETRLQVYLTEGIIKNPEKELNLASLLEGEEEKP